MQANIINVYRGVGSVQIIAELRTNIDAADTCMTPYRPVAGDWNGQPLINIVERTFTRYIYAIGNVT